jgi:predicted nucleic acid-binding protein
MRSVFADTSYWVALANPRDQWNSLAKEVTVGLGPYRLFTTEEVLTEFLNFFAERGPVLRAAAIKVVQKIIQNPNVTVMPQTRESFNAGLQLYDKRQDKGYSLTDCISMERMREQRITEVLTADHHFEQDGFVVLMKQPST